MPANRSRASRSRTRERLALILVALVSSSSMLADTTAPSEAQLLADAADDLAGSPAGSRARRVEAPAALPAGELVVTVKVNAEPMGEAIVLQDPERGLLVERGDLAAWRVATPPELQLRDGIEYVVLGEVPGLHYAFDRRTSVLDLKVDPAQFVREQRALYDLALPDVAPSGVGAFLNYDAELRESAGQQDSRGYAQLGLFGDLGVLTSDWAVDQNATSRLNTTFTHDSPASIATLRVGDFVGANSSLSAGQPIGGIQWATNFATRPGLVPIPLQRLQGQVSVPSTVEVFVNGVPAYRTEVAPGPFVITDIPVVTGSGTVEMVITDALGRRQVVTNPFYASPTVLRAGLTEYSYEVGALRVPSTTGTTLAYDIPVARLVHRAGLTDAFTFEFQAEGSELGAMLGASAAVLTPGGGVFRFGLADSASTGDATGALGYVGFERLTNRWSLNAEYRHATEGYAQIGSAPVDPLHSRTTAAVAVSYNSPALGSVAVSARTSRNISASDSQVATLTWTRGFGGWLNLSLSASHDDVIDESSAFASFSVPFGGNTTASLIHSGTRAADGSATTDTQANLQRNLGTGPSWGYRLGGAQGGNAIAEIDLQGNVGTYRLGAERSGGVDSSFATASGALILVDGSLHASRKLYDGFALVRVPGAADVGVFADNNFVGRTDADGELLVPLLIPYRATNLTLDATALPIDLQLKSDRMSATVAFRTAPVFEFPGELTRAYIARLVRVDGKPVPAGATLRFDDLPDEEPIGSDGFVYLTVEPGPHRITATWAGRSCTATVTIAASAEPVPELGDLVCKE